MSLLFWLPVLQIARDCVTVRELVTSEQLLKYYIKSHKPCYKVWYFAPEAYIITVAAAVVE